MVSYLIKYINICKSTNCILFVQISLILCTSSMLWANDNVLELDSIIQLNEQAIKYRDINTDTSIQFAHQALIIAKRMNDKRGVAQSKYELALSLARASRLQEAINEVLAARDIFQELKDSLWIAKANEGAGNHYTFLGDYEKGLSALLAALEYFERKGSPLQLASCYDKLAVLYVIMEPTNPKALEYAKLALTIYKDLNDLPKQGNTLNILGHIHMVLKNYEVGTKYFEESVRVFRESKLTDSYRYILAYANLGGALLHLRQYDQAEKILQEVSEVNLNKGYVREAAGNFDALGNMQMDLNMPTRAVNYYQQAVHLLEAHQLEKELYYYYQHLANAYQANQEYKKAYAFEKLYAQLRDTVLTQEKTKQIVEMETKYESEKKDAAIKILNQKQALKSAALKQKQTQLYYSLGGILLLLVLFIVLIREYRYKKRANTMLQQMNDEIAAQKLAIENQADALLDVNQQLKLKNKEIGEQAEELQAANDRLHELDAFKENMTGMIVHDLKNPLNAIIGLSEQKLNPKTQMTIHQSGKQMLNMVMNMLDIQKYENSKVELALFEVSFNHIFQDAIDQVQYLAQEKGLLIEGSLPYRYVVRIDKEIITRVLVNLLTNAIKYSPNNETVTVQASQYGDHWAKITVIDHGEGIPEDKLEQVFERFGQYKAKNAGVTGSTGLGLTFCKMMVEAHDGEIGVQSKVGEGFILFYFAINSGARTNLEKTG